MVNIEQVVLVLPHSTQLLTFAAILFEYQGAFDNFRALLSGITFQTTSQTFVLRPHLEIMARTFIR